MRKADLKAAIMLIWNVFVIMVKCDMNFFWLKPLKFHAFSLVWSSKTLCSVIWNIILEPQAELIICRPSAAGLWWPVKSMHVCASRNSVIWPKIYRMPIRDTSDRDGLLLYWIISHAIDGCFCQECVNIQKALHFQNCAHCCRFLDMFLTDWATLRSVLYSHLSRSVVVLI